MIGKLKGLLVEVDGNEGLIETAGGVFYRLYLTPGILAQYAVEDQLEAYTYLHVKEDGLTLYGFENKKKYQLFQMLLGVDGVGPKLGFAIISFAPADQIVDAIMTSNHRFFSSISGVGKKTAQKILLELSGKFDAEFSLEKTVLSPDDATVIEALKTLGFDTKSSHSILDKVEKNESVEAKIQQAIKLLTKK